MSDMILTPENPKCVLVFAAGSGGDPERHSPLLSALAEGGCKVIAPQFERIVSPFPSAEELAVRAHLLKNALQSSTDINLPVIGMGHSIGATLLLALAGGQMTLLSGQELQIPKETLLQKLILFTPPTGFFRSPGSLDKIQTPIQLWAGSEDSITPPAEIEFLKNEMTTAPIEYHLIEGAGHFSFMNSLPPNRVDSMPMRKKFLEGLPAELIRFI